jgi:membrane protease YdiL (CAAX protease family)
MTETLKLKILFEISTLCLIGTLIGLAVFWFLNWNYQRKHQVDCPSLEGDKPILIKPSMKIDGFDLMVVMGIILFFYANQVLAYFDSSTELNQQVVENSENKDPSSIGLVDILLSNIIFIIVGAIIFALASFSRGRKPKHVFGLRKRSKKYIIIITMAGMFVAYIAVFIGSVISNFLLSTGEPKKEDLQEIVQTLMTNDDISLKIAIALSAIIFAPLIEEVIFRGYLYPVIKRFSHPIFSCVITSLLFAVIHSNLEGLMPLFLLAIVLTIFYEISKSIWVPILMHACFNGVNTISILILTNAL